jgi:hypothetical protein
MYILLLGLFFWLLFVFIYLGVKIVVFVTYVCAFFLLKNIPEDESYFSLSQFTHTGFRAYRTYLMGKRVSFPEVKCAECAADHSYPFSDDVKHEWRNISTPSLH